MTTAAEIRKRVREAEKAKLKAREDAAVNVATRLDAHAAAQDALAAAQAELAAAIKDARVLYGSAAELARVLDVSPALIRSHDKTGKSDADTTAPTPPADPFDE